MSSSVLIHFVGVLGIHIGSLVYKSAYNSTSTLSALIWLGRLFFLEYALLLYPYTTLPCPWPSRKTYPNQADRLEEIRTKDFFRGGLGPFAEIMELKAFAKSIIKREGAPLNLSWAADDHSFVLWSDKIVFLKGFCTTYHQSIIRVQHQVNELMLGWKPEIDLTQLQDDLACPTPGWSFLERPSNHLNFAYKSLSRLAWSASFCGKPFEKNSQWLPEACSTYLESSIKLARDIFARYPPDSQLARPRYRDRECTGLEYCTGAP
jgi:hypothetical protein